MTYRERELYVCRLADCAEIERRWDALTEAAPPEDRGNWDAWRVSALRRAAEEKSLVYYGFLQGRIICEATASLCAEGVQNAEGLVGAQTAYLSAFRTDTPFRGQGFFSKLFRFMLDDLKTRGFQTVTLGVEPHETKNRAIYAHWGFDLFIRTGTETYPDGTQITVSYYGKKL